MSDSLFAKQEERQRYKNAHQEFIIELENGGQVKVKFDGATYSLDHYEFYSDLTSETGYRSYFGFPAEKEKLTVKQYAQVLAQEFNKELIKNNPSKLTKQLL